MKKKLAKLLAALTFLGATGIFYSCTGQNSTANVFSTKESATPVVKTTADAKDTKKEESTSQTDATLKEIYVYVCGQVKNPGVYTLRPGARVNDVIKKAGGLTKDAFDEGVNLAKTVHDEDKLYIPSKKEAKNNLDFGQASKQQAETKEGVSKKEGIETGRININTATKEELMSLPGVGESKAANIISYRETKGSFATIDDLKKVTGIKTGVFTKIKQYITVE